MFKGLKSLLTGILAGTAVGILFSPKSGKDLRKKLKTEVDGGGTGLGTLKETLTTMGKEIGDTAKECYDEVTASEEFQEGKKKLKKSALKAKAEIKEAYKKNVTPKNKAKVKKAVKNAKKSVKKTVKKVVKKLK